MPRHQVFHTFPVTQVNTSIILDRDVYGRLKELAKRNKRSVSKQVAYWVEQQLEIEEKNRN